MTEKQEATNKEMAEKMQKAMEAKDQKMQEDLQKQSKQMREMYEKQLEAITAKMTNVSRTEENFRKMQDTKNADGFARIAGYGKEKDKLVNIVGKAIALEKSGKPANVPNGILFYGPMGNGKSTFAGAFAKQLCCRLDDSVESNLDEDGNVDAAQNLKNIREAAKNGQEHFEKTGQRTIIQIDELDAFAPKELPKLTGAMKDFMDNVSKKYHCTIFATTNHPEDIDPILLRDGRFDLKAGLPPADKSNALAVLKHYGDKVADETVNFDELADEIVKVQPDEAYSNARIESVVTRFMQENSELEKMSHTDFLQSIRETDPDISKRDLDKFAEQIKYMKGV